MSACLQQPAAAVLTPDLSDEALFNIAVSHSSAEMRAKACAAIYQRGYRTGRTDAELVLTGAQVSA